MDFRPSAMTMIPDNAGKAPVLNLAGNPEKDPAKSRGKSVPAPKDAIMSAPFTGSAVAAAFTPAA